MSSFDRRKPQLPFAANRPASSVELIDTTVKPYHLNGVSHLSEFGFRFGVLID